MYRLPLTSRNSREIWRLIEFATTGLRRQTPRKLKAICVKAEFPRKQGLSALQNGNAPGGGRAARIRLRVSW